jgi:uncharacterized protein (TIGR02145 family)
MKKNFTLLIGILFSITILNSQVAPPQAFSFKATIKDKNGLPVLLKKINLRITILQGGSNGSVAYSEFFTPTTDLSSQVDVQIGRGKVVSGSFLSIDWSSYEYFLKIEVDIKGGTSYQVLSVTQLLSVPYALYAGKAGTVANSNETDPIFKTYPAYGISRGDIDNWNTTIWSEIKNTPSTIGGYGITDAVKITDDQTIGGNKTFTGTTTVSTPVNPNDAATKAYVDGLKAAVDALAERVTALESGGGETGSVTDINGNVYNTITIGTQTWMKENLRADRFNDGTGIVGDFLAEITSPGNIVYDQYLHWEFVEQMFGRLYNYYVVDPESNGGRNVCPSSWHVPTDVEWTILTDYLGGEAGAGAKLKETKYWATNEIATNETGFSAFGGGFVEPRGEMGPRFLFLNYGGFYWSSTLKDSEAAWDREMYYDRSEISRQEFGKTYGLSIRCLKDN